MLLPSEYSHRPQGQKLLKVSSQTFFKVLHTLWSNNHSSVKSTLTCPPCDDKPATGTNALTSIHVFNDCNRNGSNIKGLHVKVNKVSTDVYGVRRLSERGKTVPGAILPRHAARIWYVNVIKLWCIYSIHNNLSKKWKKVDESTDEEEWPYLVCREPFSCSRPREVWVQCQEWKNLAHSECTPGLPYFVCPNRESECD